MTALQSPRLPAPPAGELCRSAAERLMDLQELFEEGRRAAVDGAQCLDNPYRVGYHCWIGYAWLKGFLAGRTPDPACPRCSGSGTATLMSSGEPSEYDGIEVPCVCNAAQSIQRHAEPGAAPDRASRHP